MVPIEDIAEYLMVAPVVVMLVVLAIGALLVLRHAPGPEPALQRSRRRYID